jgi:hypothetical protein
VSPKTAILGIISAAQKPSPGIDEVGRLVTGAATAEAPLVGRVFKSGACDGPYHILSSLVPDGGAATISK